MLLLLAAPVFGVLGPSQGFAYEDDTVKAALSFRIANAHFTDTGPGADDVAIATGTLKLTFKGLQRTYNLARILPIREDRIQIYKQGECGTGEGLTRGGHYFVVEAVIAQKGCASMAVFIDLVDGSVAEAVVLSHEDPYGRTTQPFRVTRSEVVNLNHRYPGLHVPATPWPFVVLHAVGRSGDKRTFAYCIHCGESSSELGSERVPSVGTAILLGPGAKYPDFAAPRNFPGERTVYVLGR